MATLRTKSPRLRPVSVVSIPAPSSPSWRTSSHRCGRTCWSTGGNRPSSRSGRHSYGRFGPCCSGTPIRSRALGSRSTALAGRRQYRRPDSSIQSLRLDRATDRCPVEPSSRDLRRILNVSTTWPGLPGGNLAAEPTRRRYDDCRRSPSGIMDLVRDDGQPQVEPVRHDRATGRRNPTVIAAVGALVVAIIVGLTVIRKTSHPAVTGVPPALASCPAALPLQPAGRPPKGSMLVPRPATAVRLCRYPARGATAAQPLIAQREINDPSQVQQLRTHVNALSAIPPGKYNCGAGDQGGLALVFNTDVPVIVPLNGCRWAWSPTVGRQLSPGVEAELLDLVPL